MKIIMHFPKMTVEVENKDIKEAIEEVAMVQEILSEPGCGVCQSHNIRWRVRAVGEGKQTVYYYEMVCEDCRGKLTFGQKRDGSGLFPHRKLDANGKPDDGGRWGAHRGWTKWKPPQKENSQ